MPPCQPLKQGNHIMMTRNLHRTKKYELLIGHIQYFVLQSVRVCTNLIHPVEAVGLNQGKSVTPGCDVSRKVSVIVQDWIMSMWKKSSFITSVAASSTGELLVVMSQGVTYTQQAYRCAHTFPYAWVRRKWKAGFRVTSMCCTPWSQCWAVVMSKGTAFELQVCLKVLIFWCVLY